jgi:acetyl-CoA carboxylase biotin carboxyl carrier protein
MARHEVITPVPGVFYRNPGPGKAPYATEGDRVEAGQVIGLVEIMKQFSEVKATVAGVLEHFAVGDTGEVAPGAVIAVVEDGQ